jgi:Putative Ig domain
MDIARWSGVSTFGSPRVDLGFTRLYIGEPPINSGIVLKRADGGYRELFNNGGALGVRSIAPLWTPGRDPMIGVYGGGMPNAAIWARGAGGSTVAFVSGGIYMGFGVSNAGAISAMSTMPAWDPRTPGITILGGTLESPSRVVIDSAPGTPSGLILQSVNETPWVIWVDSTDALRTTDFTTFRYGQVVLTITTASLPGGTIGTPYNQTLVSNSGLPVTWDLSTGTLPVGLTLNATTGAITGTPSGAGTSNFTARATRGTETATKALSIVVA